MTEDKTLKNNDPSANENMAEVTSNEHLNVKTEADIQKEAKVFEKKLKKDEKQLEHINSEFNPWKITSIVLAILLIIAIFTGGFTIWSLGGSSSDTDNSDKGDVIPVTILSDSRCGSECDEITSKLTTQLKSMLPNMEFNEVDYNDKEGKEFYAKYNLTNLPAIIISSEIEDDKGYDDLKNYLVPKDGDFQLQIMSPFNPTKEICDNGIDDTGNGKVDCDDDDCKGVWKCMEKKDVPDVDAYVMSYCPFGTQIEKGLIPVVELLKDKINFNVKFVNYAMHGKKELDENLRQYCIQKDNKEKYISYLKCFLASTQGSKEEAEKCMKDNGINKASVDKCVKETDEEYGITKAYEDKSTWSSGRFPLFSIYDEENKKYGIRGSPHLMINGVSPNVGRDPEGLLKAVCLGFDKPPKECDTVLSSQNPSPGFGSGSSPSSGGGCGQ